MTSLSAIQDAALRMQGHVTRTPLLNAPLLDRIAGRRVLVKAECLQRTGSFKLRGAWSALSALPPGAGVLAFSSGNHAQGVAYAGAQMGRRVIVVMPSDAPRVKIENTRAYGAEVVLYDRATEDRAAIGARLVQAHGLHLVVPYDDPQVIAGQGTVGLEIAEEAPAGAEVLVCCGGGGLASGIALALEGRHRIRTVEPEGFDDMARSLAAGQPLRNPALTGSVCDAILTPEPGALTFPILQRLAGPGLVVSDAEALAAVSLAFTHLRLVLEPGGAVALAAALFRPDLPEVVVAVASGGNVDPATHALALSQYPDGLVSQSGWIS